MTVLGEYGLAGRALTEELGERGVIPASHLSGCAFGRSLTPLRLQGLQCSSLPSKDSTGALQSKHPLLLQHTTTLFWLVPPGAAVTHVITWLSSAQNHPSDLSFISFCQGFTTSVTQWPLKPLTLAGDPVRILLPLSHSMSSQCQSLEYCSSFKSPLAGGNGCVISTWFSSHTPAGSPNSALQSLTHHSDLQLSLQPDTGSQTPLPSFLLSCSL